MWVMNRKIPLMMNTRKSPRRATPLQAQNREHEVEDQHENDHLHHVYEDRSQCVPVGGAHVADDAVIHQFAHAEECTDSGLRLCVARTSRALLLRGCPLNTGTSCRSVCVQAIRRTRRRCNCAAGRASTGAFSMNHSLLPRSDAPPWPLRSGARIMQFYGGDELATRAKADDSPVPPPTRRATPSSPPGCARPFPMRRS